MIPRYAIPEMARIWTDEYRFAKMLEVEILAAEAMSFDGLVPKKAIKTIRSRAKINVKRIQELEEEYKHDVIAFLAQLEESVGKDARYLHMGLTSSDVLDTSLAVQMKEAAEILLEDFESLANVIRKLAWKYKNLEMMGRTHGIHAEPITLGLKFASWYTEIKRAVERIKRIIGIISYGKISGAVGTFAHMSPKVEAYVCRKLKLKPEPVSTQIVPRDRHAEYLAMLAVIAGGLERFAVEIRSLQRTEIGEFMEPFSKGQRGSSAMPHKRNPVGSENICGLARLIRGYAIAALEDIALWNERDISHSCVERVAVPDATIALDFAVRRITGILEDLRVNEKRIEQNLNLTKEFLASQKIMLALVGKKLPRQQAYKLVQRNALEAWDKQESFKNAIFSDLEISALLSRKELEKCFDMSPFFKNVKVIMKRCL